MKIIMTSYFHNGTLFHFFEFLTTLAQYSATKINLYTKTGKEFDVTTDVLQSDVLAPFLFIIVLDFVMQLKAIMTAVY